MSVTVQRVRACAHGEPPLLRKDGRATIDGSEVLVGETFVCEETTSDPRVSGTSTSIFATEQASGHFTSTATLANAGGTWRGSGSGFATTDFGGIENHTIGVFIGEGGYAGLRCTELFYGSNTRLVSAGWIEPVE